MIVQTISCLKGEAVRINHVLDPIVPAGIAGWTIRIGVKATFADTVFLVDQVLTVTDAAACTSTTTIPHASTNIAAGTYYFDIWRIDSGNETPLTAGPFIIEPAVRY